MKHLLLILVCTLVLATQIAAQESRREITNPAANPADDAKGLSDKVPDVYAVRTQFDRVVILRAGKVVADDTPAALTARPSSVATSARSGSPDGLIPHAIPPATNPGTAVTPVVTAGSRGEEGPSSRAARAGYSRPGSSVRTPLSRDCPRPRSR